MKLYVTRHGQSVSNVENRVAGFRDVDLTKRGEEQAEELAKKVAPCQIDVILASPLLRAKRTAAIVSEAIGVDVILDERLKEQGYGIYEGGSRDNEGFIAAKHTFSPRIQNGESTFELVQRVFNCMDEIKQNYPHKNVLLVSHDGVCKIINAYFNDVADDQLFKHRIKNCEIKCYDVDA